MSITSRAPRNLNLASKSTDPHVGPGTYETYSGLIVQNDSPYPFLTTAARFVDNPNQNPGPADYNPVIPTLDLHGGGCMMRSVTGRKYFDIGDAPDSCKYQHLKNWEDDLKGNQRRPRAPMSSRSPRSFEPKPYMDATPADYNLRPSYEKGVQIPKSARPVEKFNDNPGPGAYETSKAPRRKKNIPSHQFLSARPREIFPVSDSIIDNPGLGHDEWKRPRKSSAPFGSKAKKQNFWASKKTPGPGQYDVEYKRKHRKSSAPFGNRGPRDWAPPNDNPGPGSYKDNIKRKFKDDPDRPFGQRAPKYPKFTCDNPTGPGQYNVDAGDVITQMKKVSSNTPSFKISTDRTPFKGDPTIPGPGMYSPDIGIKQSDNHKLKRCMDGSERYKEGTFIGNPINDAPGPGRYNPEKPEKRRDKGGYMPHTKRGSWVRNTCAPSPEKYHVENSLVKPSLNVTYSVCKL
ncbi:hypothetical protein TRFO_26299 [Tritrichomonas foetus]|uniref:Outer dense fiber protein 3 n=1 Tax=Tritrichomonas foetus TaxID=1144522 RepID=A0A1J4K8U8_9EUKA|nr:hypothetical protein TRFO_26299 [Tritrichomonas foetus]|eukprot:OHT05861.1 hypothetical protein TRFO_26299 [Tritrichomonas foetus]